MTPTWTQTKQGTCVLIKDPFNGHPLNLIDKLIYLSRRDSLTERDVNMWTAINSDLPDKIKRDFFQVVVPSVLLYWCTTWTLTKLIDKNLDNNWTNRLRAIMNESLKLYPKKQQVYNFHLISIQVRHMVQAWKPKDEFIIIVLLWYPSHGCVGQPARTNKKFALCGHKMQFSRPSGRR